MMKRFFSILLAVVALTSAIYGANGSKGWRAGVAKTVITPKESIWMAGYAARNKPSEGVLMDIWAKALAIEDSEGERAVIVTSDIIGFRGDYMANRIRERLFSLYGLTNREVVLSASHTHTGPNVMSSPDSYPDQLEAEGQYSAEHIGRVVEYSEWLEDRIVEIVGEAISSLQPAKLYSGQGVARFAVNRRNYRSHKRVEDLVQALEGPVDHSVPVIKVENSSGEPMAILFGYACHNTTLPIYLISGDYAGFAQLELEKSFPEATALYFAGAGADQNPLPRGTIAYAKQYGKTLAAAVEAVIDNDMRELSPSLTTSWSEVELKYANPTPTIEELEHMIENKTEPNYLLHRAGIYLQNLKKGIELPQSYFYPIQLWRIGEQNMLILSNEVVVDYAIAVKGQLGEDLFVMAYANEMIGYIPSARILGEGDYEGTRSLIFTTPWEADIENKIISEVMKLAEEVAIKTVR